MPKSKSPTLKSPKKPLIDLSAEDQQKVINESGVLHKIKEKEEESLNTVMATLLTLPLFFTHTILDYIVHFQ